MDPIILQSIGVSILMAGITGALMVFLLFMRDKKRGTSKTYIIGIFILSLLLTLVLAAIIGFIILYKGVDDMGLFSLLILFFCLIPFIVSAITETIIALVWLCYKVWKT